MCPLCGYETLLFDDEPTACPHCDRSQKRAIDRRLHNSDLVWMDDGPVMLPVDVATQRQEVYEILGVTVDDA